MTAIQTSHEPRSNIPTIARITATLRALAAQALNKFSAGRAEAGPWHSLDDRLLRDIGATPLEAEVARLEARMGAVETDILEAVACRGLSAGQFLHRLRPGCYRNGV